MTDHLSEWLHGKGIPFQVDGVAFSIRQPTTEEYDDAISLAQLTKVAVELSDQMADVRGKPVPDLERLADELERMAQDETNLPKQLDYMDRAKRLRAWTVDQYLAQQRAVLARDRWLTARLLCNAEGEQMFDTTTAAGVAAWERLPLRVKNAAMPHVRTMLGVIEELPFVSETPRKPESVSASDSGNGPTTTRSA